MPGAPRIPGPDATGTLEDLGAGIRKPQIGDRVAIDTTPTCGECEYRVTRRIKLCFSASAEYVVATAKNVYLVSDEVDLSEATEIKQLSHVLRGLNLQPRRIGDQYSIYGAGTMGASDSSHGTESGCRHEPLQITKDEITIPGSMAARHSFRRAVEMFCVRAIVAGSRFSRFFGIDGYEAAMQVFRDGTGRKLQIPLQDEQM